MLLFIAAGSFYSQCAKITPLLELFEQEHYSKQPITDSLSEKIVDRFIDLLDEEKKFFTASDLRTIKDSYPSEWWKDDDQFCEFLRQTESIYEDRIQLIDSLLPELIAPVSFEQNDQIYTRIAFRKAFPKDLKELQVRWQQRGSLHILYSLFETDSIPTKTEITTKKNQFITSTRCRLKLLLTPDEGLSNSILNLFFNAITTTYDPHSSYFNMTEMKIFEEMLSTEVEGFGISIDKNQKNEIIISHIVPGSSAWQSGNINENDKITQLIAESDTLDLQCLSVTGIFKKLSATDIRKIELTIEKNDGSTESITLKKGKLESEDNTINSYILDNGSGKIGFIMIPSFYTSWSFEDWNGCANDVAKEILKLKSDGIEGIILDLRYNGGGSMKEAIDFAGIFIDHGPLTMLADSEKNVVVMKDFNRGLAYDGPLGILINGSSASASEVLAGALQDYNRAIIIGSPSFGKASMQSIRPVVFDDDHEGFVKLTLSQIFRLNGISYQQKGIQPDIELFSMWEGFHTREKDLLNSIYPDSIDKKVTFSPFPPLPVKELQEKSSKRQNNSTIVAYHKEVNEAMLQFRNIEQIPLSFDGFKNYYSHIEQLDSLLNTSPEVEDTSFKVSNHRFDETLFLFNSELEEQNKLTREELSSDISIRESYAILVDYIQLIKAK